MDPQTFAAERKTVLDDADDELEPFVEDALHALLAGDPDWEQDLVVAASELWLNIFNEESDLGKRGLALARFRRDLKSALQKTAEPEMDVPQYQIDRMTYWLSGYVVNSATTAGASARGVKFKRWTSMHDDSVRETHVEADGQIVPIGGTFDVGGVGLHHPGEPVGPPEIWIQCRCLAQPAAKDGEAMSGTTYTIGPEDEVEDNPDIIPGSDIVMAAAVVDEADIAVEPADEDELPDDDVNHEVAVHGVLAPEGVATGDGRKFAIGSLSTRTLPIPLRYEIVSTHGGTTSDVVTVGRVDNAWRNDDTDMWEYTGVVIDTMPYAADVLAGIGNQTVRGVSIDGDDAEIEMPEFDDDADLMDMLFGAPGETVFTKMRVAGLTIVPIPAFQEAYIALGHEFSTMPEGVTDLSSDPAENWAAAARAEDGNYRDVPTEERNRRAKDGTAMPDGSYPIADCSDLKNAIQAIGRASDPEATKRHIKKRKSQLGCDEVELPEDWAAVVIADAGAPIARLFEPAYPVYPAEWFSEPTIDHAFPMKIDRETRRVYGYISEWGVCHVGMAGMCQEVPQSASGYAYFLKGVIDTTEGEMFVGNLTWGGHASRNASMSRASEFYDKPDAVRAFVNVGENAYGVWFAGIIPPDVTDDDITKMRAIGAVSGDWREVRGSLELIGVPVVNTPGLPVRQMAASAGRQTVLIGAGALKPEPEKTFSVSVGMDAETAAGLVRAAVAEYRHQEQVAARAEPARAKVRERRLAAARARTERD